jgi:hypothetical protein
MRELFPIRPTKKPGKRVTKRARETAQKSSQLPVYFLQCEMTLSIKIGESTNIERRVSEIQTAHAGKLTLLGKTDSHSEDELHERFRKYRLQGEWFSPSAELIEFLIDLGFSPRTAAPLHPGNPFWMAAKLHGGEWYPKGSEVTDLQKAVEKHVDEDYCSGNCEECDEDPGYQCDDIECPVLAAIDLAGLFEANNIDGVLVDDAKQSLAVIFRRDQFASDVEYIRGEIRAISAGLDSCWRVVPISWDENGDFQFDDPRDATHG